VWVIAETRDLGVRYIKSVVTDDRGATSCPTCRRAVRRLGARLRPRGQREGEGAPGAHVNITAVTGPDEAAAAQYYPAIYWYSMLKIPSADQFGATPTSARTSPRRAGSTR
jgi:hypothetical protein